MLKIEMDAKTMAFHVVGGLPAGASISFYPTTGCVYTTDVGVEVDRSAVHTALGDVLNYEAAADYFSKQNNGENNGNS